MGAAWADIQSSIEQGQFRELLLADGVTAKVTRHGVQIVQAAIGQGTLYMPTDDCKRRIERCQIEIGHRQANINHLAAMLAQIGEMQGEYGAHTNSR